MTNTLNIQANGKGMFSTLYWRRLPSNGIKKNKYNYIIWNSKLPGSALLYAPLSNAIFQIGNFGEHLLDQENWLDRCFNLIPEQEIDDDNLNIDSTQLPKSMHFSIGISERCSLNCVYCHVEATGATLTDRLDYSELNKICNFIARQASGCKTASISFACGGEPTIEWTRFKYVVEKIRYHLSNVNVDLSLSMTTNGIYGDNKRRFIVDNFANVTLSLDGTEKIQNTQRPLLSGKGSYQTAIDTAHFFRKNGLQFAFRSTVCRNGLSDMADFVKSISEAFSPIIVAFEPIVQIGRGLELSSDMVDPWQFCESYWDTYKIGKQSGVDVRTSMLNLQQVRATFCGAMAIPSITFAPNGIITGCHRDVKGLYQYGEINKTNGEITINNSKLHSVRGLSIPPNECENCFCRWTCGGDCPDIRQVGNRCNMIRELTFRSFLGTLI